MAAIPGNDASAVVKEQVPGLEIRCSHARKESNLRSSVLETATPPWLERKLDDAHDGLRAIWSERW